MDGFVSIAFPLTTFTQKNMKFEWSEECEGRLKNFKDRLTSATLFSLSEGTKDFVVHCDAYQVG